MSKEHTLSQNISRVNFKELQQIIKMGLVQGNLIPAFAGAWLAVVMTNHSFLSSIPQILLMLLGSTLIMGGACALIIITTKILIVLCLVNKIDQL